MKQPSTSSEQTMNNRFPQHILLVEDNDDHAELIGRAFDDTALPRPHFVRTLKETRQAIEMNRPDLVIIDLFLPDGKGTELLFAINEEPPFPIIVMSSRGDEAKAVEAMKNGALDYLVKSNEVFSTMPKLIERAFREWRLIIEQKHMIGKLQRSEHKLQQAMKMEAIGTLAGGIAHDFNNILTAILGYSQLALQKIPPGDALEHDLQQIQKAGDRAKHLVKQILAFNQQSTGPMQPNSLRDIIEEALQLLRPTLPSTIDVQTNLSVFNDTVLSDSNQIHQVLVNLCTNAEASMRDKGGKLDITLQETIIDQTFANHHPPLQHGKHLALAVSDTGRGISPENLEYIFDPFFTTKNIGQGSGLGLSVAHGIITQHGGGIIVTNKPDKGTTFTVFLPQIDPPTTAQPINHTIDTSPQGTGRILFVDDEELLVELGKESLEAYGYEVIAYTDSREAHAAFLENPDQYDAVVTDQTMPHLTGEALARKLLRIRPHVPIILLTGFSHAITPEQAQELGVASFLMKPILPLELAQVLKQTIGHSRKNPLVEPLSTHHRIR